MQISIKKAIEILNPDNGFVAPMAELYEALRMGMRALERLRWIPVTERLPQENTRLLVRRFDAITNTAFVDILSYENGDWWNRHAVGDYAVSHWAPLPETDIWA